MDEETRAYLDRLVEALTIHMSGIEQRLGERIDRIGDATRGGGSAGGRLSSRVDQLSDDSR